jgi:molybdopterin-guanine dinucleotide biosynthesis protein A, proteobacterial
MTTASAGDSRDSITGVVLAGGLSRRMARRDKAWLLFAGRPMIERVIERLRPQVDHLIVNANGDLSRYQTLGVPVISDIFTDFCGPLAGWHAALHAITTPWLISVPCDSPRLPMDLVARLYAALPDQQPRVVMPCTARGAHPVFALLHLGLLPSLTQYIESGERKVENWCRTQNVIEVPFDDQPEVFCNINTEQDLHEFEAS